MSVVSQVYQHRYFPLHTPQNLTLDSGAFTAWSTGKQVDVHAYADWALAAQEQNPHLRAVNLDVIPGVKGRNSTSAERIAGMRASLVNADTLRARGLDVMEVA